MAKKGVLYLCPTPIGNLEDITLRALKILREVDLIAAEDTRVTIKLLNHFQIKTPLTSYHEHNKRVAGEKLLSELRAGKNIALVSDAGTPGLSDPGEDIVSQALEVGIRVVPLPGAVAAICALVASGLCSKSFVFEGFLPKKAQQRQERLQELKDERRTIIIYEAPHRITKTLKDLRGSLGDRFIVIAREMTKLHEEFIRGTISKVLANFKEKPPRGEMVIIVEGNKKSSDTSPKDELNPKDLALILQIKLEKYAEAGLDKKRALKEAARDLGFSRNEAYDILLKNQGN